MRKVILLAGLMAGMQAAYAASSSDPIILGYYSNWDVYNPKLSANPAKDYSFNSPDNLHKLARVNSVAYAFLEAAKDGTIQFTDFWSDLDESNTSFCQANAKICFTDGVVKDLSGGFGNFNMFANSGQKSGITNRLVAFGGAGHDAEVEAAMNNPANFINSLKVLRANFNITGLDIDYEPTQGVKPENIPKLIALMKNIRSEFGDAFMITYTINLNQNNINAFGASNWAEVVSAVNYINIMGYDVFGPWGSVTGLQSPLYVTPNTGDSSTFSDHTTIAALNENGVPLNKIVLGYPSYGRAVSGVKKNGLGQIFTASYKGNLDNQKCEPLMKSGVNECQGMIAYSTISKSNYSVKEQIQNGVSNGAYSNFKAESGYGSGTAYISFDNVGSVTSKVNYAIQNGLAGVMTWGLNYDAPPVNSDNTQNPASLLNAVGSAYGIQPRDTDITPASPYFVLQVSNLAPDVADPNAFASATLVVSSKYYVFGNQWNKPISPQMNQPWGTQASSDETPGVIYNGNLDTLFSNGVTSFKTDTVLINGYPSNDTPLAQPNTQTACSLGNGYTFEAGHSYNIMVNAVTKACDIKMMN